MAIISGNTGGVDPTRAKPVTTPAAPPPSTAASLPADTLSLGPTPSEADLLAKIRDSKEIQVQTYEMPATPGFENATPVAAPEPPKPVQHTKVPIFLEPGQFDQFTGFPNWSDPAAYRNEESPLTFNADQLKAAGFGVQSFPGSDGGIMHTKSMIVDGKQIDFPANSQASAPTTLTEVDPGAATRQAQIDQAYAQASEGWNQFQGAFGGLPESARKQLGDEISQRIADWKASLPEGTAPTQAQADEMKWMCQAQGSADWAGRQAQAHLDSGQTSDLAYAKLIGGLYNGGQQYITARNQYLQLGGAPGQ